MVYCAQDHDKSPRVPANWDAAQIPNLQGKLAIVTGGSSGIGFETALALACKGAHVVIACPADSRSRHAEERIREAAAAQTHDGCRGGSVEFMKLDLSDLHSVKAFAKTFLKTHSRLDLLVNNAGIMGISYELTADGIERQFATNYLGHFALTNHLLEVLQRTSGVSRIVTISSLSHRFVQLDRDHVMATRDNYLAMVTYGHTKLCNLTFALELDRRLRSQGISNVISVACHPGYAHTNIMGPPSMSSNWFGRAFWSFWSFSPFSQEAKMGALPTLYAATAPGVHGGDFYGPGSAFFAMWGYPAREEPAEHAKCKATAVQLWVQSEQLANLTFELKPSQSPSQRAESS